MFFQFIIWRSQLVGDGESTGLSGDEESNGNCLLGDEESSS